MRRRLALFLLALLLAAAAPSARAGGTETPWLTREDETSIIHYAAGYEADADLVLGWMHEGFDISERVLGERLQAKAQVYLHPSIATWPGGENLVESHDGQIDLLTPSQYRQTLTRTHLPRVIAHEVAHLVSSQMRNGRSDTAHQWFWEGLADYVSIWGSGRPEWVEMTRHYEEDLRAMAGRGDLNGFAIGSTYFVGSHAVRYLVETYGIERVRTLVRTSTGNFQDDIHQALGVTWKELHDGWLAWVSKELEIPLETLLGERTGEPVPIRATRTRELVRYVPERTVRLAVNAPFTKEQPMVPLNAVVKALGAGLTQGPAKESVTITLPAADTAESAGRYLVVDGRFLFRTGESPTVRLVATTREPISLKEAGEIITGPAPAFLEYYLVLKSTDYDRGSVPAGRTVADAQIRMVPRGDGTYRSAYRLSIHADSRFNFDFVGVGGAEWTWTSTPDGKE